MNFKKNKELFQEMIFFAGVFALSLAPVTDFDIWFHIKSGEIISKLGIIHSDVFAFTTAGREWTPYEWLFQLFVYFWTNFFGINSIPIFVSVTITILIFIFYKLARKVFDIKIYPALIISFIFFVSIFEFISPRPQIIAYTFFIFELFLILLYFFKKKNYLWATIPVTLLWANMHGSIFLAPLFFAGFTFISLVNTALLKDNLWLVKAKILGLFTLITIFLTVLPPLGLTQYNLLIRFWENRELISRFIAEWAPLSADPLPFAFYILTACTSLIIFSTAVIKSKSYLSLLWTLPFIGLVFSPFLATRNAFYGYIGMGILILFSLSGLNFSDLSKNSKRILILLTILVLAFFAWLLNQKKIDSVSSASFYPVKAAQFIKEKNLSGHMFNEYGFGGYLLYTLYPQQKVYFDGRTDLYLCCEMPDTLDLSYKKRLSDSQYKKVLDKLWNKNNISFVLLRTEKNTVLRKIERILQSDPDWSLVFWDDASVIFVRRDGKNDGIIKSYGAIAATPYNKNPYIKGSETQAFNEYLRMIKVADSSKSRNTLGFLFLQKRDIADAKRQFEKAISLYPYNESPYMNLAEILFQEGDGYRAIDQYKKAKDLAPDRGLIYIRLGQIIMSTYGDREEAKNIWNEGLVKTSDNTVKNQLQQLINSN